MRTDPGRLRQVLLNLVSNAVKFSTSGAVTILADRQGRDLLIRVSDTGPGMAPEAVGRVFDENVQGGVRVHREFGGAGLGLAIASRVAAALGGSIEVSSRLGVGSTFTVRLPGTDLSGARAHPGQVWGQGSRPRPRAGRPGRGSVPRARRRRGPPPHDDPEVTLEVVVAASVPDAQRVPPARAGRRQLILVPAALASCPPLAGTALALRKYDVVPDRAGRREGG